MTLSQDYAKLHMGRGMLNVDERLIALEAGRVFMEEILTASEGQTRFTSDVSLTGSFIVEIEGIEQDLGTNYTVEPPSTIVFPEGLSAGCQVKISRG